MSTVAITYPSETMFSYELKSNYYFGVPTSVSPSGLAMDADRLITLVKSLDGDTEKPKQFMLKAGATGSALEHSVPEQLWSTPENPANGISAVKALQIANDQGIPIYTINKDNINTILPQLQIDYDDKTDIKNAVNAGKEVTVSKTNISFNGWTGVGYIVIDPKTGAGGYMISGGMSGAYIMVAVGALLMIIGLMTEEFGVGIGLIIFGMLYIGIGLCIINESAEPLRIALAAISTVIGAVFTILPGTGAFVTGSIISVLFMIGGTTQVDNEMRRFCGDRSL